MHIRLHVMPKRAFVGVQEQERSQVGRGGGEQQIFEQRRIRE